MPLGAAASRVYLFCSRALRTKGDPRVKPTLARSARLAATFLATATAATALAGVSPALAGGPLQPDPAPSSGGASLQPDPSPRAASRRAAPPPPSAPARLTPQRPAEPLTQPPAQPRSAARTHHHAARAHHVTEPSRPLPRPFVSSSPESPLPPPAHPDPGHGLDRQLLVLAASMLLLVVLLGGSLLALAVGRVRAARV
jgi:hypothetical protein